jgi:hypothetical protein
MDIQEHLNLLGYDTFINNSTLHILNDGFISDYELDDIENLKTLPFMTNKEVVGLLMSNHDIKKDIKRGVYDDIKFNDKLGDKLYNILKKGYE